MFHLGTKVYKNGMLKSAFDLLGFMQMERYLMVIHSKNANTYVSLVDSSSLGGLWFLTHTWLSPAAVVGLHGCPKSGQVILSFCSEIS